MAVEFKTLPNAAVAVLPAVLDDGVGQELVTEVKARLLKGGKLVVDASRVTEMDYQGLVHLISVRMYVSSPEQKCLLLAGMTPDAWRKIEDQGFADMFDSRPSLAEAVALLPAAAQGPAPVQPPARPAAENVPRADLPAQEAQGTDVWGTPPLPPTVQPAQEDTSRSRRQLREAPDASLPAANAWATYKPRSMGKPGRKSLTKQQWIIGGGVLGALLVASLLWYFMAPGDPTISLSAPSVVVEIGNAPPTDVYVTVKNGKLAEDDEAMANMPKGLSFGPGQEDGEETEYQLYGKPDKDAKSAKVTLTAVRGGRRSPSKILDITIKPKWDLGKLESLPLEVEKLVPENTKFVTGASSVVASNLPEGLRIVRSAKDPPDWELQGKPSKAGVTDVTFTTTDGDGEPKVAKLTIRAPEAHLAEKNKPGIGAEVKPVPSGNESAKENEPRNGGDEKPGAGPAPPPPPSVSPPPGMREFLLERIDKLDTRRFTAEERENLHKVVSYLQEARLIHSIIFEKDGQVAISETEKMKFRQALQNDDNARLLQNPQCQIFIVGYASPSGTVAANVRYSRQRAAAADHVLTNEIGRNADLCGDYGPTDIVASEEGGNRAVEVFAGTLNPPEIMRSTLRPVMDKFKADFNQRHGMHRPD